MKINQQKLKKIQVETRSGQVLGRIINFDLETDSGVIVTYHIKSKIPLAGLFEKELIISRDQIVDFTDQKMVVEDGVIKEPEKNIGLLKKVEEFKGTESIITSEKN